MESPNKNNDERTLPADTPGNAILYPAVTWDYRVTANGKHGFGLVAARKIKKGKLIYGDSPEFAFTDVVDNDGCCDYLLLGRHKKASRKGKEDVPSTFPLTRHTLLTTHGVPNLIPDPTGQTAGTISWLLEVPGMLMNHSCDPNVTDYPPNNETGEAYAKRDIAKNEELTCDYALQYYDHGPFFPQCECGASKCRGSMMGFKELSAADKARLLPAATNAVKAMYYAEMGTGLPVQKEQQVLERNNGASTSNQTGIPRIVFPGPSYQCETIVDIQKGVATPDLVVERSEDSDSGFALCANRKFAFGERIYEFWRQDWPTESTEVDMVFAKPVNEGDPPEGTMLRFNSLEVATRERNGKRMFSGWDMLKQHSCEPNTVYEYEDWDEEEDWCRVYAAREIQPGEALTMDFNSVFWDRSDCKGLNLDSCHCGSKSCAGTVRGFKFLSGPTKEAYKMMSVKHVPAGMAEGEVHPGEVLAPFVRVMWRKDKKFGAEAPDTDTDDEESSSSSSSGSED